MDEVKMEDLFRVANLVLRSKEPTIVAKGKLNGMGDVKAKLQKYGLAPRA